MAVKDDSACRPTEGLVLGSPRRHFRTIVSPIHWQLRSLIGADKNSVVYPSGKGNLQIKRLNTATHETETIKLLSFSPRCLVVEGGWICCGGENGEFAAIQLEESTDSHVQDLRLSLDAADARLPFDVDSIRSDDGIFSILARSRSSKSLVAGRKTFGKERVNCITLWFPPTQVQQCGGAYSQAVAILANNDHHVTVVSLRDQEALDTVEYPDAVNRAVISPDGRLLAGISDDPYLYIHERVEKSSAASSSFRATEKPLYEWKMCRRLHLPSQRLDDTSDNRGSFAVCFSNTGRYLAVGTQYGTICIFTGADLTNEEADPLFTSFTSSRPNSELGAVRVMAFCPGPFDLLAWTEDRGRVGVADVRGNFLSHQIMPLDQESAYEHIEITDRSSIDPRLLDNRNERDNLASTLASTLDLSSENRGPRSSDGLERYNYPFSPDDTVVLEALQEHRRRREQRAAAQAQAPTSSGTRFPGWMDRSARPTLSIEASRGSRDRSASVSRAVSDILINIRDERERLRDSQERLRDSQERLRDSQERIRAQLRDNNETERRRVVPQPTPRRVNPPGAAETDALPSRRALVSRFLSNAGQTQTSGGWADIEALYNLSYEANPYETSRLNEADMRRRDRAALFGSLLSRVQGEWEESATRRALGHYFANRETPPELDETAGLAWSADGRVLYVGAEDGIYEFHVNVFGRKLSPSITMR